MLVAHATAIPLVLSELFALAVVLAPFVGLRHHPCASLLVSLLGAVLAGAVIVIEVAAPLTQGAPTFVWPGIAADYILAMAHILEDAPYPFSWTPHWVFWVGRLTPLIAVGGVLAVAAGYPARRTARRISVVMMVLWGLRRLRLRGGGCVRRSGDVAWNRALGPKWSADLRPERMGLLPAQPR